MLFRQTPRALAAWCGAALCALVAAGILASDFAAIHARARAAGGEVTAVVVVADLPLGSTVTAADVDEVGRYSAHLPARALRRAADAVGRVVTSPLLGGALLTEAHLAPRHRSGLDGVVPPGMRAVRVVTDDALTPSPGAVVDVIVTFDPTAAGPDGEPTVEAVRGALVIGVDSDGGGHEESFGRQVGVTLLTDAEGARRLAYATANGIVTLALVPPEEACCRSSKTSSSGSSKG